MPETAQKDSLVRSSSLKIIITVLILLLIFSFGLIGILLTKPTPKKSDSVLLNQKITEVISGIIDLNGYIPVTSFIEISEKKVGGKDFIVVTSPVPAVDGTTWSFSSAEKGTLYEIKATLKTQNKIMAESDPIKVTAPATDEILRIVSKVTPETPNLSNKTVISGTVDLNGYLPPQSLINILVKKNNEPEFNPIISNLKASDGAVWSFNDAQLGMSYQIQAVLLSNNQNIGQSPILSVTAPATSEVLVLTSKATAPPSSPVSISGTVNLNGYLPPQSLINISARVTGKTVFNTVVSGIAPVDGNVWNWTTAQPGISYDIQAYLVVSGNIYSQSPILTVTAPAYNEVLTFNSAEKLSAPPPDSLSSACLGKDSSGKWQVSLSYNRNHALTNAQQFLLQFGTSDNDSSLANTQTSPSNPKEEQSYTTGYVVTEGQTYYARYAYSICNNCPSFSLFSNSKKVVCLTPTNTPIPTATPVIQPTATPTIISPTLMPTEIPIPTDTPTEEPSPPAPTNAAD